MDTLIRGKDYFLEVLIASASNAEMTPTPAEDASDVSVVFSATDGGDAITSGSVTLSVACTDTSATKTVDGQDYQIYTGTLSGADTLAALATYTPGQILAMRTVVGTHERDPVHVKIK